MTHYEILFGIQCLTIIGVFIESWIIFRSWKNALHGYLLLHLLAVLIHNVGYLLELEADNEASYLVALKFSYAGRIWIAVSLFLFAVQLCRIKLPEFVRLFLVLSHALIYWTVLTTERFHLYYKETFFVKNGDFPMFRHVNGIGHHAQMTIQALYMVAGFGMLIYTCRKEKIKSVRRRLLAVILSTVVESGFFILQMIGIPGITDYYDVTTLGYFFVTIIMLTATLSFDLLGTGEIAKEFVLDRISEGIIAADGEGVVRYVNEPAKRIYPELAKEKARIPDAVKQAAGSGESITVDDRIYSPEENELLYGGESFGKLYALVDETEHFRYMEELQEQKKLADSASEAKSRFLANMSHEIRTPINAVLGMDEMILREAEQKEIRSYASDIMSAGKTLLSLINDILDFSKVEEGKMEIIPVQYDLCSLLHDLANMIREPAGKKGLEFRMDADYHIPHLLYGDEIRIRQCVLNLLTNAVKYTEKGSVTLKVFYDRKDEKNICLSFAVEDTGIGMKEEDMERLFSPYQRFDEKRNRSIEGTGLGMSITRQLLELMGSSLLVESKYGEGSKLSFTVEQEVISWDELGEHTLHLDEQTGDDAVYHELFHAPEAGILVVDDTEMNLTVMTSLLKKTGIRIDTVLSGKEALQYADRIPYDVIFIDHMMPGMDGIETLKHIRESEKNRNTPTVALTANAVSGARQKYLSAGFTDYLSKPVDGTRLEKMLMKLLPKEKLRDPEEELPGAAESEAAVTLPDALFEIPELDTQAGLKNCGSEEGYLSVLTVFHQTAQTKAEEIETLFENQDLENYAIRVHALKSSARIIGDSELSALAQSLEKAGKEKDIGFVRENTDRLLSLYRSLDAKLQILDRQKEDLPPIEPESLKEAWQTIVEVAQSMDYELMEVILNNLRSYLLPPSGEETVRTIEMQMTQLDWEGIAKTAGEALQKQ